MELRLGQVLRLGSCIATHGRGRWTAPSAFHKAHADGSALSGDRSPTFGAAFCGVWVWAVENLDGVERARRAFDVKTG